MVFMQTTLEAVAQQRTQRLASAHSAEQRVGEMGAYGGQVDGQQIAFVSVGVGEVAVAQDSHRGGLGERRRMREARITRHLHDRGALSRWWGQWRTRRGRPEILDPA